MATVLLTIPLAKRYYRNVASGGFCTAILQMFQITKKVPRQIDLNSEVKLSGNCPKELKIEFRKKVKEKFRYNREHPIVALSDLLVR